MSKKDDIDAFMSLSAAPKPRGSRRRMTDAEAEDAYKRGLGVSGDSYAVREELKLLGCQWYAARKKWVAPTPEVLEKANEIVLRGPIDEEGLPEVTPTQVVASLQKAPDWMLVRALRGRGVKVFFEARETLADAVAGWPPTIEDLAPAFDYSEFSGGDSIGGVPAIGAETDPAPPIDDDSLDPFTPGGY